MLKIMAFETYNAGKVVCVEDKQADYFYLILTGKIEIFSVRNGTKLVVRFALIAV
jgi:CRP-like cAMP-binding protein